MGHGPHPLGVSPTGEVALFIKDQFVEGETVLTQEEIALVEAMFAPERGGWMIGQRSVRYRLEGGEVDTM